MQSITFALFVMAILAITTEATKDEGRFKNLSRNTAKNKKNPI